MLRSVLPVLIFTVVVLLFSISADAQTPLDEGLVRELAALHDAEREGAHIGKVKAPVLSQNMAQSHLRYFRAKHEARAWPKGTLELFAQSSDFPRIASEGNLPAFVPLALNPKAGGCVVDEHFTKSAASLSLYSGLDLKQEQTLVLHTGNRGGLSVFVDGMPVFSTHGSRLAIDQHSVALKLKAGHHRIRFELRRDQKAELFARITDTRWREIDVGSRPQRVVKSAVKEATFTLEPFRSIFDDLRAKHRTQDAQTAKQALALIESYALYEHAQEKKGMNDFYSKILRAQMAKATFSPHKLSSFYLALARVSDEGSAWDLYDIALSIDPKNADAHLAKARALASLSEREALPHYRRARLLNASASVQHEALEFEYFYGNDPWRTLLEVKAQALKTKDHALVEWALQSEGDSRQSLGHRSWLQERESRLKQAPHDHAAAVDLFRRQSARGEETAALVQSRLRAFPFRPEPRALELEWLLNAGGSEDPEQKANINKRAEQALYDFPGDPRLWTLYQSLRPRGENVDVLPLRDIAAAPSAHALGAEILFRETLISIRKNHRASIERTQVVRVHSPKRLPGLQRVNVPFREGLERVLVLEAYAESRDGQRFRPIAQETFAPEGKEDGQYLDSASVEITFPPLEEGMLLVTRVRVDPVGPQPLGEVFGYLDTLSRTVHTHHYRLRVKAPLGTPLLFSQAVHRTEDDTHTLALFEKNDLAAMKIEKAQPPFTEMSEVISLTTEASWASVAERYRGLIGNAFEPTPELSAYARTLVPKDAEVTEIVDAAFKAVTEGTRYIGVEFGLYGFKPRPAETVWRRGFGDCKDKSGLLIALLSSLGVEAKIVLVRTRSAGVIEDAVPSLWHFNHAIVYVPLLGAYMDPTLYLAARDELPAEDRGAQALVISDQGEEKLKRLQEVGAAKTTTGSLTHAHFSDEGALHVRGEEVLQGAFAPELRVFMRSGTGRDKNFERVISNALPGFALDELSEQEGATSGYRFSGTVGHFFDADAKTQRIPRSLFREDLVSAYALESDRETPVVLGPVRVHAQEVRFYSSETIEVFASPEKTVIENAYFVFTQEVRALSDARGVAVKEVLEILLERVPPADYAEFQKAAARVDALQTKSLTVMQRGEGGS